MVSRQVRLLLIMFAALGCICISGLCKNGPGEGEVISFREDFENGADQWDFITPHRIKIVDSGDARHGKVLALHPGGAAVYALIKGSEDWTNIKIEGEVFFPSKFAHYMGLIYNYNENGTRADFGSVFIYSHLKCHPGGLSGENRAIVNASYDYIGSVAAVNPHRDSNASRALYTEYTVQLAGDSMVKCGEWHRFKGEIFGPVCHFYVDDMKTPKLTYNFYEFSSGRVGFKPRYSGTECRIDNIKVTSLKQLSYKGPILPAGLAYNPGKLMTKWDVIGPFTKRMKEIENDGFLPGKSYVLKNEHKKYKWKPFKADGRGCVLIGKVCGRYSGKSYVYVHTEIFSQSEENVTLQFSTRNKLVLWLNGAAAGEIGPQFRAHYDFLENPEHKGREAKVLLKPGVNHLVILARGGRYGGDGFFARCSKKSKMNGGNK